MSVFSTYQDLVSASAQVEKRQQLDDCTFSPKLSSRTLRLLVPLRASLPSPSAFMNVVQQQFLTLSTLQCCTFHCPTKLAASTIMCQRGTLTKTVLFILFQYPANGIQISVSQSITILKIIFSINGKAKQELSVVVIRLRMNNQQVVVVLKSILPHKHVIDRLSTQFWIKFYC